MYIGRYLFGKTKNYFFSDPLMDCKECKERFRADKLIEDSCPARKVELPTHRRHLFQQEMKDFHLTKHNIPCPPAASHNFTRYPPVQPDVSRRSSRRRGCRHPCICGPSGRHFSYQHHPLTIQSTEQHSMSEVRRSDRFFLLYPGAIQSSAFGIGNALCIVLEYPACPYHA